MTSNTVLVFDSTKPDNRCQVCRHHKFLVISHYGPSEIYAIHTHIDKVHGNDWPEIFVSQCIHWWGRDQISRMEPPCLGSYKKIGGNK